MRSAEPALKVAVLGAGSFGTVLANLIAGIGHRTTLWTRSPELALAMKKDLRNPRRVSFLELNPGLNYSSDLAETLSSAELLFITVPSKAFPMLLPEVAKHAQPGQLWVSGAKGFANSNLDTMSSLIKLHLGKSLGPDGGVGAIGGPNISIEIAHKMMTATVIASSNFALRKKVKSSLTCKYLRVFESSDLTGLELVGSLKNIYAIVAGISDALGFQTNTKSLIMARSLSEMAHLLNHKGANIVTLLGVSGLGDLIATCYSKDSRNYSFGHALGSGLSPKEAIAKLKGDLRTVEGLHTTKLVELYCRKNGLNMPVASSLYRIIYEGARIKNTVWSLLKQTTTEDTEFMTLGNAKEAGQGV